MRDTEVASLVSQLYEHYGMSFDEDDILDTLACDPDNFRSQMIDLGIKITQGSITITTVPPFERKWVISKLKLLKECNS